MNVDLATLIAVVVGFGTIGTMMLAGNRRLDRRIERVDAKLDAKIDSVHSELIAFRLETREALARHDERLTALERNRPGLIVP